MKNSVHKLCGKPPPKLKKKDKVFTWVAVALFIFVFCLAVSVVVDYGEKEVSKITWVKIGVGAFCLIVYIVLSIYLSKVPGALGGQWDKKPYWAGEGD